jgi:small subunit ribosomal protein S24e
MEVEIQSKTNNPLLNRTEVHFTVHHESEKTPKRELVRNELAEKLNVKKENVIVNFMKSSFGSTDTVGYAKVYKSVKEAETWEKKYVLKRNNILTGEKKPAKEEPGKPAEQPQEKQEETAEEPKKEEPPAEQDVKEEEAEKPKEEKTAEQPKEETAEEKKE